MMNKIFSVLKKILIVILLIPIHIAKGISKIISTIFKSLMYSIRGKIAANFLSLYLLVAILIVSFVMSSFLYLQLNGQKNEIYSLVNAVIDKYEEEVYDYKLLSNKVNAIADLKVCGIKLEIGDEEPIYSRLYEGNQYLDSFYGKLNALIKNGLYSTSSPIYYLPSSGTKIEGEISILLPIKSTSRELTNLAIILLIGFSFGYIFLWLFGSTSIRKILNPLYEMTLEAKKISISNMDKRLEVSKAKYELKDLAITLNDMLDRLGEDYIKQKRFVSDVSHELRTPISIINGYANMLERWGKEDEEILNESISAIISEVKNMQVLVENLLTLVRSDNQTLVYNKEVFYLNELIGAVIKETQMINNKNHDISCFIDCPIQVELDLQKTKQMLRIFVDNAVKYTPDKGKIEIRCYKENTQCHIHVIDTGIGISKHDLPKLFDRFYRSDESRTRQTGGHGLGLAIAKVIVLGHNGSIRVKSKLNEGSEFIINLPCI